MLRTIAALASILILAAACAGGKASTAPTPSPSTPTVGLTQGLVAYLGNKGLAVMDPASGKSKLIAALAPGAFRVAGPVWGPAPGLSYPVIYFTLHDDRPAESRDSAGVVPYDWLFRVDPFSGAIDPVAATQDSLSEGPLGLVANGRYLALTLGCCADYEVDVLDLMQPLAGMKTMVKPTDSVTFFTEGIAPASSGLIAVRAYSTGAWFWLNADAGVLNPFPLKLGSDDGPLAISPDGRQVAVALPDRGALVEPISVAVPLASPSPTPGITPSSVPTPSHAATPSAPAAPRLLNTRQHPDGLDWSPDGKQVMAAANGELELYDASAASGSGPVNRYFGGQDIVGVAWSSPIPGKTMSAVKPSPGPQAVVDALLTATKLPAAADTPGNRPFTKVYLWQFDSSKASPIASITDATPAVLAKYPPLDAGVVIHHWAPSGSWVFLGGCLRYRVVITASIPPVAATVGLAGDAPCLEPTPTPTLKTTPKASPS